MLKFLFFSNFSVISEKINNDLNFRNLNLHDDRVFLNYYRELFNTWCTNGSKRLGGYINIQTAIHIWSIFMRERCRFFDSWISFLVEQRIEYISRDSWDLFFEFCREFNLKDFSNYDFQGTNKNFLNNMA